MSNLVYLMCSLPSLSYGEKPPISNEEFLWEAQSQLSKKSFRKLEELSFQNISSDPVKGKLKKFTTLIDDIQKDMSEMRSARRQKRAPDLINFSKSIVELNPLERELAIMQWQWDKLSDMEVGATFTMTELMVYKLKLELVHRIHSFNEEHGAKVLDSVVNPSQETEE